MGLCRMWCMSILGLSSVEQEQTSGAEVSWEQPLQWLPHLYSQVSFDLQKSIFSLTFSFLRYKNDSFTGQLE